jgi:hypothetical protein
MNLMQTTASGLWTLVGRIDGSIGNTRLHYKQHRNIEESRRSYPKLTSTDPTEDASEEQSNSLLTGYGCPAFLPCATLCAGLPDEDWNRRALTRVHVQVWGSRIESRGIGWSPNCSLSSWESLLTHTMVAHTSNLSLYQ